MGLSLRDRLNPSFVAHTLAPNVGYVAMTSLESSSWDLLIFEHSSKYLFDINKSPIASEPPSFLKGPLEWWGGSDPLLTYGPPHCPQPGRSDLGSIFQLSTTTLFSPYRHAPIECSNLTWHVTVFFHFFLIQNTWIEDFFMPDPGETKMTRTRSWPSRTHDQAGKTDGSQVQPQC